MKAKTKDGREVDLALYKFDSCPYCQKVFRAIERIGVAVTMKDTMRDAAAAKELVRVGGDSQVPCLFIDGEPLYESDDIVQYLEENFGS